MREDLLKKVAEKEALAILTDSLGNVIWESDKSPVAAMYGQYFEHQFSGVKAMVLYANQAGIAMGIMAGRIPIRECHGVRMSEGGLKMFREMGVAVTYAGTRESSGSFMRSVIRRTDSPGQRVCSAHPLFCTCCARRPVLYLLWRRPVPRHPCPG